jgi:integrase
MDEKRTRGRPRREYPYVCGPYKHGRKWRLLVRTSRSGGRYQGFDRTFQSVEAARTWQREYERQVAAAGRTVEDAIDAYMRHSERKGNKASSLATARFQLRQMFPEPSLSLVDVTRTRAQQLYDALVDSGVAVDTHRGALSKAKSWGVFCRKEGWLKINPFEDVEGVGRRTKGKQQLTYDETRAFEDCCYRAWCERKDRAAIAGLLSLMFSMRASEVSQLRAIDIDNQGRILRIGEVEHKTEESKRLAQVPPRYRPILLEIAASPALPDGRLFSLDRGAKKDKPADRHWVLRAVRRLMKEAGVRIITAHGLRGTSATIGAAHAGAQTMSTALGHTSVGMTKAHYIDADAVADTQAERFADLLLGGGEE